jgi:hypothetical protein
MERRRLLQLWADKDIARYIRAQACRHFANDVDREAAVDEAWDKIIEMPGHPADIAVRRRAYAAINARYRRAWRRRRSGVHINRQRALKNVHG